MLSVSDKDVCYVSPGESYRKSYAFDAGNLAGLKERNVHKIQRRSLSSKCNEDRRYEVSP